MLVGIPLATALGDSVETGTNVGPAVGSGCLDGFSAGAMLGDCVKDDGFCEVLDPAGGAVGSVVCIADGWLDG